MTIIQQPTCEKEYKSRNAASDYRSCVCQLDVLHLCCSLYITAFFSAVCYNFFFFDKTPNRTQTHTKIMHPLRKHMDTLFIRVPMVRKAALHILWKCLSRYMPKWKTMDHKSGQSDALSDIETYTFVYTTMHSKIHMHTIGRVVVMFGWCSGWVSVDDGGGSIGGATFACVRAEICCLDHTLFVCMGM